MIHKLTVDQLCQKCDPDSLPFQSVQEIEPIQALIGQPRANKALTFGLGNKMYGFNIYVSGQPGTGKMTAVKRFLEQLARQEKRPGDWCYVNNFQDTYQPQKLLLPTGRGKKFRDDMNNFVAEARSGLEQAFDSDEFANRREAIVNKLEKKKQQLLKSLGDTAREEGFTIKPSPMGAMIIPMIGDRPMTEEEAHQLDKEKQDRITEQQAILQDRIKEAFRQVRKLERTTNEEMQQLEEEAAQFTLSPLIDELKEEYQDLDEVLAYLEEVMKDILEDLGGFIQADGGEENSPVPSAKRNPTKYQVNVLVDNGNLEGAPLVMELNPTYNNLFGRVEHQSMMGTLVTDFTLIRPGSLHRANGGYFVVPIEEVLVNPFAWDSLKRAIRNQEIAIEDPGDRLGFISTKSLKPEPIPLKLQVILLGRPRLYSLLYNYDSDFKELFKVKADFATIMERNDDNISDFVAFISKVCQEEKLSPLDDAAIARLIEYGSRLAGAKDKLSTRFGEISDIIREATHYAQQEGHHTVGADQVGKALEERVYRSNLIHEHLQEMVRKGTIFIDLKGEKVGQINGLSVMSTGDFSFGMPNRITVALGSGNKGVIDIEREAKLGGSLHSKGVMILAGYLNETFGNLQPLSLSAQLVFEQNYGMVDGDSASSTELYALLSSLAEVPIRQGIAVTGSINQKGEIQAIGGVNEKVEGFFEVCRQQGLDGHQGVIIPRSNVRNLMLKKEVLEAVADNKFHLWAVDHADDGIEILTGKPAGRWLKSGKFSANSIKDRVVKRLKALADISKRNQQNHTPKKKPQPRKRSVEKPSPNES